MNILLFLIASVGNAWFIRLTSQPISLFLIFLILFLLKSSKTTLVITSLIVLLLVQLKTQQQQPLIVENNLDIHNRLQYMRAYPFIPFPVAYWVEERIELRTVGAFMDRASLILSPNYYFFANHPRERAAITEMEKIPFILLPFFVLGALNLFRNKKYIYFLPVVFSFITGNSIFMYPFIATSIYVSLQSFFKNLDIKSIVFLVLYFFSLLIQYVFTIY